MIKLNEYLNLLRIQHWVKNLFIFCPIFFGGQIFHYTKLINVIGSFIGFSFVASAIYIVNDYIDIESDRKHPIKKNRPLARNSINKSTAIILVIILIFCSFCIAYLLNIWEVSFVYLIYLVTNILYSFYLKHIAILDISVIALGFVLRVFCGGIVSDIITSKWLIFMTFLLALFLALAKRRDDILISKYKGIKIRKSVDGYNISFIGHAMSIICSTLILCYFMYINSEEVISRFNNPYAIYLSFFPVIIGLLRYLQITLVEENSGSPTDLLIKDLFLQICIVLWIGNFLVHIYGDY